MTGLHISFSTDSTMDDKSADDQPAANDSDGWLTLDFEDSTDQSRGIGADQQQNKKSDQAELREQRLLAEHNALLAKVAKMEQEQQQQKDRESDQQNTFEQQMDTDQTDIQRKQSAENMAQCREETEGERVCQQEEEHFQRRLQEEVQRLTEKHRREIQLIKKKQWCWQCEKEAIYHCCWNTAYCSVECQRAHWPMHGRVCRRKKENPTAQSPAGGQSQQQMHNNNSGTTSNSANSGGTAPNTAISDVSHSFISIVAAIIRGATLANQANVGPPN